MKIYFVHTQIENIINFKTFIPKDFATCSAHAIPAKLDDNVTIKFGPKH